MKRLDRVGIILAIALASSTDASAQISWPLGPQNQVHKIWGTYGQFCGDHFHEGLDLPADSGTAVLAVQNGEIVQLKNIGTPYFRYLSVGIDPNPFPTAWGYLHMNIANHPTQPRSWQVGDAVATGDTLGTITTRAGIMAHLHFEYA
ncbi:MAG: M23 family metallopeptidase, partial [Ignavibacteria bacterium]|nr:M23 family metallopeptidase [Ignavibacteria bacterium]